jgi:hypothetical protein
MQKVLQNLIEGWIENGAPAPSASGGRSEAFAKQISEDQEARQAICHMGSELTKIQDRLAVLEQSANPASATKLNFEAFYSALREADTKKSDSTISANKSTFLENVER